MKTGIFLTPGAARTAYYVGALHTLITETQIRFDVIAGTSVGSINAAFAAMGETDALISIWQGWTTDEVMVTDYKAIIKGGFFWAQNFSSNKPEYQTAVRDYIFEEKINANIRFRFNIADLTTGRSRILEYPGENIPIQKALMAAVSVPVLFKPVEIGGNQYVDGLTIEGCLLEELLLSTGIDRAFVLGVSPSKPIKNPTKSAYKSLLSAVEWNQYSEPLLAIREANEANELIRNRQTNEQALMQAIDKLEIEKTEKQQAQAIIKESMDDVVFPYKRKPIEIIPVMPEEPIEMWFGDFKPERSKKLIKKGRNDVLRLFETLESEI